MGDREFSQPFSSRNGASLSDPLPLPRAMDDACEVTTLARQQAEAALTEKLAPAQLRAVASWLRAIASTYAPPAPEVVGHSLRAQASRLDQLARQLTPEAGAVVGTVMSATVAYLMTATGQYLRQVLSQPGETDPPAEPCSEDEFNQAYHNPEFTVLLGAERLAQRFNAQG